MAKTHTRARRSPRERKVATSAGVLSGVTAGVLAGVIMMLVAMIRGGVAGSGLWLPPKMVAGLFWDEYALLGETGIILAGWGVHLVVSAVWGVLFGVLVDKLSIPTGIGAALLYSVGLWALATWVILPFLNPMMSERVALIPVWWFAYHMVYGFVLGLAPAFLGVFSSSQAKAGRARVAHG